MSHALTTYNATAAALPARSDLANLMDLANVLARSGVLPGDLSRNPEKVMAIALKGAELGVAPMAALTGIYIVEGKPTISGELMRSLAMRAGHRVYVDANNESATVTVIRHGDTREQKFTFTMADAQRAGVAGKAVWKKFPQAMLTARATSLAMRAACPDVLNGASYVPEELGADVDLSDDGEMIVVAGSVRDDAPTGPVLIPVRRAQAELLEATDGDTDIARAVWAAHGFGTDGATRDELDAAIADAVERKRLADDAGTDTVDAEIVDDATADGPDFGPVADDATLGEVA